MKIQKQTIFSSLAVAGIILFFLVLVMFRGSMTSFVSQEIIAQTDSASKVVAYAQIDSAWNYTRLNKRYEVTFLEFGSQGCSACRRMESVLEEFRTQYPNKVNVVFLNVLSPTNQPLMKYFGIAAIPTQILLNREGKEYFRHSGYISFKDLSAKL